MKRRVSLLALGSVLTLVLLATNSGGLSAKAAVQAAEPGPITGQGYHQVWGDEFDAVSPKWGGTWWNPTVPPNSIYVQNGVLHLVSRRSQGYQDISLSTESSATGHWKQGYFEARMRWTKGAGAWPAFWLSGYAHAQGRDCPPLNAELDIFEGQGSEPNVFYGTLHKNTNSLCGVPDETNDGYHPVGVDLTAGFHDYGVLWTQSEVRWYLDGVEVTRTPTYASTDQDLYIILQMWIGWSQDPDGSTPDELHSQVDWVHVWQKQAGAPANTVRPALSGTARQGEALTTTNGTWTGTAPITYSYGWTRCDANGNNCSAIPGATSQSYVLTAADVGSKVSSLVTATNAAGSASQRSYLSALVVGTPPANTVRPALSGTARQGEALTTTNGTWTGTAPITYSYGWTRCDANGNNCSAIPGATSQSYVLTAADVGSKVSSLVTATNAAGSASQRSYLSALVVGTPPANTVRPALSGTARQGEALTTTNGTWTGTAPITYSYGWTRCDANGNNCSAIPGATSQSYVLTAADVGSKVSSLVTATNAAGSASQRSYLSALVVAAP